MKEVGESGGGIKAENQRKEGEKVEKEGSRSARGKQHK